MIACFNLCISVLSGLSGLCVCVCVFMVFPCLLFICQFVCLDWRNKDIYKTDSRLPLLSARLAVTPATLKRAAFNFATWWTEAQWVWTVCLRLLPDSVATVSNEISTHRLYLFLSAPLSTPLLLGASRSASIPTRTFFGPLHFTFCVLLRSQTSWRYQVPA